MTSQGTLLSFPELEKAVRVLLKPPHLEYLKKLDAKTAEDPNYVFNHEFSVGKDVQKILIKEGVRWKPDVMKQQWLPVLRIAMNKITKK